MKIKHNLEGTTVTHGITFDGISEIEVTNEIGKDLLTNFPSWFEEIVEAKKAKTESAEKVEKEEVKETAKKSVK